MTICAIIITYKPSLELIRNVELIQEMADFVMIYDNTTGMTDAISTLQNCSGVSVFHAGRNDGMGVALNFGLQYAIEHHFDWLATFDQDSRPTKDMFRSMLKSLSEYADGNQVRILAPSHRDPSEKPKAILLGGELAPIRRQAVITSGNLIKIDGLDKDQRFDESLFIDSVDHDFCLKTLKRHEFILECQSAILIHSIGQISHHQKFGISVHATNHEPFRHYYMTRNRLYVWVRYMMYFPRWVIRDVYSHLKMMARLLIVEDQKLLKMRYMAKGFWDFLLGKKGRLYE